MEAETVYRTWRRILREKALHERMFSATREELMAEFGLDAGEAAVVAAYAATGKGTRWFVVNYRFRLANSFLNALETGAPRSLRALSAGGHDMAALGEAFHDLNDWFDHGPYVYAFCAEALDFLADHPATARPAGLRDLIAVERAAVEIVRAAAGAGRTDGAPAGPGGPWRRNARGWLVETAHDLSGWLRNAADLGRTDLPAGRHRYLVYLPSLDAAYRLTGLPARAAAVFEALAEPADAAELSRRMAARGLPEDPGQDAALAGRLAGYGVVEAAP